jgi:hypothetical protein
MLDLFSETQGGEDIPSHGGSIGSLDLVRRSCQEEGK